MLAKAALDVALRKKQIPAQEWRRASSAVSPRRTAMASACSRSANAPSRSSVIRFTAASPSEARQRSRSS